MYTEESRTTLTHTVTNPHQYPSQAATFPQRKHTQSQILIILLYTVKKGFAVFPSPAGMSLTKLFIDGNMFPLLSLKFSLSQLEFSQNPFESVRVSDRRQEFSRIFLFSRREFFQDL
jgi:hypothetical protein